MAAGIPLLTDGDPRESAAAMAQGISKAAHLLEFPGAHIQPLEARPSQSQPGAMKRILQTEIQGQ